MANKFKSTDVYLALNRNGEIRMFTDEPLKNLAKGCWESKHPFVNSVLKKEFTDIIDKYGLTWESDPILFQTSFPINNNENTE